MAAPKATFKGDKIRVYYIRKEGFADREVEVKLMSQGNVIDSQKLSASRMNSGEVYFSLSREEAGRHRFTVQVEDLEGDVLLENNLKSFEVNVLKDKIKTLFIDEYPRWESRYAALMLDRDPRIDLKAIFIASQESGRMPIGEEGFPKDRDGLHRYDILILGDVNPRHFNSKQLEDIKEFYL